MYWVLNNKKFIIQKQLKLRISVTSDKINITISDRNTTQIKKKKEIHARNQNKGVFVKTLPQQRISWQIRCEARLKFKKCSITKKWIFSNLPFSALYSYAKKHSLCSLQISQNKEAIEICLRDTTIWLVFFLEWHYEKRKGAQLCRTLPKPSLMADVRQRTREPLLWGFYCFLNLMN